MARLNPPVHGAGLGLRRTLMGPLAGQPEGAPDFLEVAPENWLHIGGTLGRQFRSFTERYPMLCHGLSLSLGGPAPLDIGFINELRQFFTEHGIALYSEHLSYCSDTGHLYDLLPIPFSEEAVMHVAGRIRQTQEILGQRIAVENVSYYTSAPGEMDEQSFINAVLTEADCDLLLDVNNVYVNSVNHGYDPEQFIAAMPGERIAYIHVAGHYREEENFIIDSHGAAVIDPVWALLEQTYALHGVKPTLLERDFNLPPLAELLEEVDTIRHYQSRWSENHVRHAQSR